jgi:FlaG/FlaF family flagellin (archaellin)
LLIGCGLGLGLMSEACAVFTFLPFHTPRRITLQVGSAGATIDKVTFDVTNANVAPSPTAVTGVSNGPAVTPAGGVQIVMTAEYPTTVGSTQVTLNVDSSTSLSCTAGGCGSTLIPFTTISWTAFNHDATYPTLDIQNGTFTGAAGQTLTNFFVTGGSIQMSNVLQFSYANSTLYPAGQYTGRVTYTAVIP